MQEFPGGTGREATGQFVLDGTLGGNMSFCITFYHPGHVGNVIVLTDPQGRDVDQKMQNEDLDVSMICIKIENAMVGYIVLLTFNTLIFYSPSIGKCILRS